MNIINSFARKARKGKLFVAGAALAVILATTAVVGFVPAAKVSAAACDQVNIIHCGLDGSSLSGYISSFKSFYNKGSDNGHDDLQAIYNWAGLSDTDVSGMNTTNTKLGTLYRNGDVKVNGKTVATDAWVSARFTEGDGFVKIKDGVWARKTTTSFANASVQVLVHYKGDTVDSVVMIDCGNAVKVTPVKPTPKPALACTSLKATALTNPQTYSFVVKASASNTKITGYTFIYGDGKTETVKSTSDELTHSHTYSEQDETFTVSVYVTSDDFKTATDKTTCATSVKTPPAPAEPALVCSSLTFAPVANKPLTYTFTAQAKATDTTITNYVFSYGDNITATIISADDKVSATHTYSAHDKTYTVFVTVNSKDVKNVTADSCKVSLTTEKVDECKPGVPKGDARCNECKPGVQVGSADCEETVVEECDEDEDTAGKTCEEETTELVNSGPGAVVGLFAGTSILGAAAHRIIRRRLTRE